MSLHRVLEGDVIADYGEFAAGTAFWAILPAAAWYSPICRRLKTLELLAISNEVHELSSGAQLMTKFLSLPDAIGSMVQDGMTVALEGFTHLIPFAAGHEIIRQQKRDLTLIRMTPDLIYDQLIGAGCAAKLIFSWGGNPGVGSLHRLRDAVENGWPAPLAIEEHAHAGMAAAYAAGASGLPFGVLRGYLGTDLPKYNTKIKFIECPFTGEKLAAVPAHRPD